MSKEIQQIIEKLKTFAPDDKAILATVVDVQGSGYRRPGARMLIDANGYAVGTVSGGCLEADVLERAKKVLETGEPTVITYDTTKDENSLFGLGMGCRGIVRILLEPIEKNDNFIERVSFFLNHFKTCRTVTVINPNNSKVKVGAHFFQEDVALFPESLFESFSPFTTLDEELGEIFVETIKPPLNLLLFGAGYDALPLARFAKELGWRVTAIDHRPAFANAERLPQADEIIVSSAEDLSEDFFADENSVAVIMTHNYERDREILRRLLDSSCLYIGALGPKKRTEKLLAELGENFAGERLVRLHAPVGLDIGAGSPEAIALAIVAEIQAVLSGRDGGFLRRRIGSIYDRNA